MDAATVVWLPATGQEEAPDARSQETARHALDEWARARGVSLSPPTAGGSVAIAVDLGAGTMVEADLDRAREAVTAEDAGTTEHVLAHAEALLRAHPELPQAAWLMAEVERAWAMRWARLAPADEERARAAWRHAAALDGGRAAGVGETGAAPTPAIAAKVVLEGDGELWVDGQRQGAGDLQRPEGEHVFVVTRGPAVVFAQWVSMAEGATVRIAVPEPTPCSEQDLARASVQEGGVRARGVRCGEWVAAAVSERPRAVKVARCERDRCGPLLEWVIGAGEVKTGPTKPTGGHWPAWATWTLIGVGVAAAAVGVTLVATGAFQSNNQTQFVFSGGVKQNAWGITW